MIDFIFMIRMLCTRQDSIEPSTLEGIENLTSGDNAIDYYR